MYIFVLKRLQKTFVEFDKIYSDSHLTAQMLQT